MAHYSNLPDEIILYIFKFLKDVDLVNASSTCRRWRQIYNDPTLWRKRTFEFNGYCRSQNERQQALTEYLTYLGQHLKDIRIACSPPNLLTAYSVAQCVETLLGGLIGMRHGRSKIEAFQMSGLYFDETWSSFRSSKYLLMDAVTNFLECQRNLKSINLSDCFMTPPFGYRVLKALIRSRSAETVSSLDISNYYSFDTATRFIGIQIHRITSSCCNLRELGLNYFYLISTDLVNLCTNLEGSLKNLILYASFWEYSYMQEIIESEQWVLACGHCPELKVTMHLEGWPKKPWMLLVAGMPLTRLTLQGGQCRFAAMTYEQKLKKLCDKLSDHFSKTLESASISAASKLKISGTLLESLAKLITKCDNLKKLEFSKSIMSADMAEKLKSTVNEKICTILTHSE